jgi:hypothetical protein
VAERRFSWKFWDQCLARSIGEIGGCVPGCVGVVFVFPSVVVGMLSTVHGGWNVEYGTRGSASWD